MVNRYDFVTLVVAIACMFLVIEVHAEMFQIGEKRNPNKYCGPILADMLAIVCNGKYNTQKYKKSSYVSGMDTIESDEDYQQPSYLDDAKLPFPYRSRSKAAALLSGSFRRYTRGVTDECCKKPCTLPELRSYCSIR